MLMIHMNRATDLQDGLGRPFAPGCSGLTVEQAAAKLNALDLSPILEVRWSVYEGAPVSIERQVAAKVRRIKQLAAKTGRIVSRVEPDPVITSRWHALLAR